MALPYLLLEAIGQGSTALGGTCSQRMSALGHKATCAPQKIMSALPRKGTFAVNSPCLLCAKSRHTSLRLSFLLSAIGRHWATPSRAPRPLSRSHEVDVAIDQNFIRHLHGMLWVPAFSLKYRHVKKR